MANYVQELLVEALIAAPGCPEPLVERLLRSAATDFYGATKAWRHTTETAAVIRGRTLVELELPANTRMARLFWAKLDGEVLKAVSERNLRAGAGVPRGYAVLSSGRELQLDATPEQNYIRNGLVAHVALVPTNALNDLPDELLAAHRDGILYGALTKLLAMPNVAWGDLQAAGTYAGMAAAAQHEARREAEASQAPVARKVRYGGI
jgi:hypothetical protein